MTHHPEQWSSTNNQSPTTSEDWADVANDAIELLRNTSPRKSDLEEFWKLVSKRSSSLSVDSLDLSVYIFQERKFRYDVRVSFSFPLLYLLRHSHKFVSLTPPSS